MILDQNLIVLVENSFKDQLLSKNHLETIFSMPYFSLITVCLNAGDDLITTVNSVLRQTFTDFEIIVKDGYSNDSSLDKLPKDDRIKPVRKKDTGIYDAMNQALGLVSGKYLLLLNAGDILYDSSVLQKISDEIKKFPEFGLYYCDYKTTSIDKRVYSPKKLNSFNLFRNTLCHQCCFFETKKFNATGSFNIKYKVLADYDFLLRFILLKKFGSRYVYILGIISKSGGFASKNKEVASGEAIMIRQDIFGSKYLINNILLNLTLPDLRKYIANSECSVVKRIYLSLSNLFNRLT